MVLLTVSMSANPFAPPTALTADPLVVRPRRPVSVWIMMIIATAAAALAAYAVVTLLAAIVSNRWWWDGTIVLGAALRIAVLLGIVGAVIGSSRGTSWGRWLGLAFIAFVLVVAAGSAIAPSRDDGPVKKFRYTNQAAGEAGEVLGNGLICVLDVWWFFAFGFSRRARGYFAGASRNGADHAPRS